MKLLVVFLFCGYVVCCNGFLQRFLDLFSSDRYVRIGCKGNGTYFIGCAMGAGPEWDDLKVTWGINPFSSFSSMPRTEHDAISGGFTKISDCGAIPSVKGKRYVKDGDYAVVLLYDVNGYIAGIQIGVPHDDPSGFPSQRQVNKPFVHVGNLYYLTAYFTDPATICTTGRSDAQFSSEGTGNSLYIQNGTDPVAHSLRMPMTQTEVDNTKWTKGYCFVTMGVHYWYNIRADMTCDEFFPMFLLYNKGKLNAFGWAIGENLVSSRLEHPPHSVIQQFMNPVPQCLLDIPTLSTLHIYFTSNPRTGDLC